MNYNQATTLLADDGYGIPSVNIPAKGNCIYVISDLHLAAGVNACGNYDGTENFFADNSFVRFLDNLQSMCVTDKATLIINGDFIDFLRITNIPARDEEFTTWQNILKLTGIDKSTAELKTSIVKKEVTYGLKTNNYKSVWKLHVCITGHIKLFERLAQWLSDGNDLIITKGNHDLEWVWKEVRVYLQYWLANSIALQQQRTLQEVISTTIIPQTLFVDDSLVIDGSIYIEHGHKFENMTSVKDEPLIPNKQELNLPLGSFFNRYLINRLEQLYPYLDNIRPTQNILLVLFRERFPFAIKILFRYLWLMGLLVQKRIFWQTLKYLFTFLLVIVLPVAITAFAIINGKPSQPASGNNSFIIQQLLFVAKNLGFLFLSYIIARIMVMVKLKGPASFYPDAKTIFNNNPALEIVTFGHTHNPEQFSESGKWYFNTGTWTPVYESSSAEVRMDKTYTFLQINRNKDGKYKPQLLQRWNDDALRHEWLGLTDKK
jgi:UDP-2,3-diacylglucosamine pyrophosphatase LpxH